MFRLSRHVLQALKKKSQISKLTTLKNGLRVASLDMNLPTMSVGLWCNCGSRFENEENSGIAHFFEHLVFKGSEGMDLKLLTDIAETKGMQLNAYTSREQTVYFSRGFSHDAELMVKLLANIVQFPELSRKAIHDERGVVLREIQHIAENSEETIYDALHEVCFRGTPLSFPILGPPENVKKFKRHQILDFVKTHYITHRMVLCAAGGISHDKLCELGSKYFEESKLPPPPLPAGTEFKPGCKYLVVDEMPYVHVGFACESVEWTHQDTLPLMLASQMLGQWDRQQGGSIGIKTDLTARFEKEDLAMTFKAFNTIYVDIGLWGIYLIVNDPHADNGQRTKKAIKVLRDEFANFAKPGYLTEEKVELAKKNLVSQSTMCMEGAEATCEDIGRQILTYGRRIEMEEWQWRVSSITVEDVRAVMEKYVVNRPFAFSAMGPKVDLELDEVEMEHYEEVVGKFEI